MIYSNKQILKHLGIQDIRMQFKTLQIFECSNEATLVKQERNIYLLKKPSTACE
jgi:hypothetical protein